jgi:hypothetical protein
MIPYLQQDLNLNRIYILLTSLSSILSLNVKTMQKGNCQILR